MKYTLWILTSRAEFIIKDMRGNAEAIEVDGEFTKIGLTIESEIDLHNLFHAGTKAGINHAFQILDKQSI